MDRYEDAAADFTKAIDLDPTQINAYAGRGKVEIKLGLTGDACKDLQKAQEMGATDLEELIKENCK
jgi:tetratricopeptide (TPR) repeat protein